MDTGLGNARFFLLFGLQGLAKLSGVLVGRLDLISRVYDILYTHTCQVYSTLFFSFLFSFLASC